jgi:hypothetical protein
MYHLVAVNTICYPAFWSNPIGGFLETIGYLSQHRLQIQVLFDGKFIPHSASSLELLVDWMLMSIPLIFQWDLWWERFIIARYSQLSNLQRACPILVLFKFYSCRYLPLLSTLLCMMECGIFIYVPGIAVISATALFGFIKSYLSQVLRL